ncbi:hypothetical protein [Spirosoma daeguense]
MSAETTPRGANTTHNPIFAHRPNWGVSRVTRDLPNLSKPKLRGGWPVSGDPEMEAQSPPVEPCALSTES